MALNTGVELLKIIAVFHLTELMTINLAI